jgi:DNA-binding response OmpR family regulator
MSEETVQKVLVADDDPALRELIVLNLRAEGLEVDAFDNGEDAYQMAPALQPDLIVLDVMMPKRDGLSALAALKADSRTAHIPVVLLTAKATDAEVWQGWEAGADYYITKPFDVNELLHFVKYLSVQAPTD